MLGLPPTVRIYFATDLADMRKGIDGLRAVVEGTLRHDPYAGHLFVFVGKARYQTTFGIQFSPRGGALPMAPAARSDAPPLPHDR